jgi:dihydrofolate reductase
MGERPVRRLTSAGVVPADDAIGAIQQVRAQLGGGIQVWGSRVLATQLIANDLVANELVDDYYLLVQPILLGGGKRLFPDNGIARPLELESATTAGTGVLICHYGPAASSED